MLAGDLALLDDALPLRVVLVLDEIDDGVDLLGVNVPLRQNEFLLDDGMIVLNRTNVASLVLWMIRWLVSIRRLDGTTLCVSMDARVIDVSGTPPWHRSPDPQLWRGFL